MLIEAVFAAIVQDSVHQLSPQLGGKELALVRV